MIKTKTLRKMKLALDTGSKRKQTLSERLTIKVEGERSDVEVRLTLRQARALRKFLNEKLDNLG